MKRKNRSIRAKPDRFSSLPDSLLSHILSFIPTQNSVLTSVLARRWRYLWRDVPNFDFNFAKYRPGMRFVDAVNRVMALSNMRNINNFRLIAMYDNLEEYNLEFQVRVPAFIFTCETLVDLELHFCGPVPDAIYLPNLKRLHLERFKFGNDEKLCDLISGCPVLEELNVIQLHYLDDMHTFIVSSPTIKRLTLNFDLYDPMSKYEFECFLDKLEINTPTLGYLVVKDRIAQCISAETFTKCISTGTFSSLVEANIRYYDFYVPGDIYSNYLMELIEKVDQVKCLTLSIGYYQFLESSFAAATSKFINLTRLDLAADWLLMLKFLEGADNLQTLIIREVEKEFLDEDKDLKRWTEPQQVPTCLSSHLRLVTIHSFEFLEAEFEMVSYILRNGKVLKLMDIITQKQEYTRHIKEKYTDLKEEFNALQRICVFERRSETCKVQFS